MRSVGEGCGVRVVRSVGEGCGVSVGESCEVSG